MARRRSTVERLGLLLALAGVAGCNSSRSGPGTDGGPAEAAVFDATGAESGPADAAATDAKTEDVTQSADAGLNDATDATEPTDAVTVTDASDDGTTDGGTGSVSCNLPLLLTSTVGPTFAGMDADDQFVYWYEPLGGPFGDAGADNSRVSRVPADGSGPAVPLWEGYCEANDGLAFDASNVFIGCRQTLDATRSVQIIRVPKNGTAPAPLFIADTSVPSLNHGVQNIGTDGTNVYFSANLSTFLGSIPVGGGTPTSLLSNPPPAIVDGFNYFTTFGGSLFWLGTYNMTGSLLQVATAGGTPALIANDDSLSGAIDDMVIHGGYFYWKNNGGTVGIWQLPLAGGAPTLLTATMNTGTGQMAIFGPNVYFAGYASGQLLVNSVPIAAVDAGAPTVVGTINPPSGFAAGGNNWVVANSTHLFVADSSNTAENGHIYRCQ